MKKVEISFEGVLDDDGNIYVGDQLVGSVEAPPPPPAPKPKEPEFADMPLFSQRKMLYEASGGRGAVRERVDYPVLVYQSSKWYMLYSELSNGKRSLMYCPVMSGVAQLASGLKAFNGAAEVVCVQAAREGVKKWVGFVTKYSGRFHMNTMEFAGGIPRMSTETPVITSDVIAMAGGDKSVQTWNKVDNFVKKSGVVVDYIRDYYHGGEKCTFHGLDRDHQVYTMAVHKFENSVGGDLDGYVALLGLFAIANEGATQYGGISPVWAYSRDGINWLLPYGKTPAFGVHDDEKMILPTQFMSWGSDLILVTEESRFGHNTYEPGDVTSGFTMRVRAADAQRIMEVV